MAVLPKGGSELGDTDLLSLGAPTSIRKEVFKALQNLLLRNEAFKTLPNFSLVMLCSTPVRLPANSGTHHGPPSLFSFSVFPPSPFT